MKTKTNYNAKLREELLTLARKYTNYKALEALEKNSTVSHEHCVRFIYHNCIDNITIKRLFLDRANKLKNLENGKVVVP